MSARQGDAYQHYVDQLVDLHQAARRPRATRIASEIDRLYGEEVAASTIRGWIGEGTPTHRVARNARDFGLMIRVLHTLANLSFGSRGSDKWEVWRDKAAQAIDSRNSTSASTAAALGQARRAETGPPSDPSAAESVSGTRPYVLENLGAARDHSADVVADQSTDLELLTPRSAPPTPSTANHQQDPEQATSLSGGAATVVGGIPSRPKHFVSRRTLELLRDESAHSQVVVVVTGMRGVGKTQLAAAYARERVRQPNELVGWIDAETTGSMLEGLSAVAERIGVADPKGNPAESANRLRDHLASTHRPALLILDNATDPDQVAKFLPATGQCRVIITSTNQQFGTLGTPLAISVYDRPESVRTLIESTGIHDHEGASRIARELEDLPLALTQAAATISTRHLDYASYLDLLSQPLPRAFTRLSGESHPSRVDKAILLSIETISADSDDPELDRTVRELLDLLCMLSPSGISTSVLPNNEGRLHEALARCTAGSVLTRSTNGRSVRMHRLIGRVLRERAETSAEQDALVSNALTVIERQLFALSESWQRRIEGSHLTDQIDTLWTVGVHFAGEETRDRLVRAREWEIQHLTQAWDSDRARQSAVTTLADLKKTVGDDHHLIMPAVEQISRTNRSHEAQLYFVSLKDAAIAANRNLGPGDPRTCNLYVRLADSMRRAGQYSASTPLLEEAVAAHQEVLGADHPSSQLLKDHLLATSFLDGRFTAVHPPEPVCFICRRPQDGHPERCIDRGPDPR